MRKLCLVILLGCFSISLFSQSTFPVNGVADERETTYAFKNATIVKDAQSTLTNATMIVRNGKIITIGTAVTIPFTLLSLTFSPTMACRHKHRHREDLEEDSLAQLSSARIQKVLLAGTRPSRLM